MLAALRRVAGAPARRFAIAALMRPPDPARRASAEEHGSRGRARRRSRGRSATTRTGRRRPRPPDRGDPAARVRAESSWLRAHDLAPRLFCGGGWYMDAAVAAVLAGARLRGLHRHRASARRTSRRTRRGSRSTGRARRDCRRRRSRELPVDALDRDARPRARPPARRQPSSTSTSTTPTWSTGAGPRRSSSACACSACAAAPPASTARRAGTLSFLTRSPYDFAAWRSAPLEPRIDTPEGAGDEGLVQSDVRASRPFFLSPAPLRLARAAQLRASPRSSRSTSSGSRSASTSRSRCGALARARAVALGLASGARPRRIGCRSSRRHACSSSGSAASTRGASSAAGSGAIVSLARPSSRSSRSPSASARGYDFTTYAAFPTGASSATVLIGLFRASYDSLTRDIFRARRAAARRCSSARASRSRRLRAQLGRGRGGIDYDFLGASRRRIRELDLPLLGSLEALAGILAAHDRRRADRHRPRLRRARAARDRRARAPARASRCASRRRRRSCSSQRGEYVPGQGVPLFELRPPVFAGTDWVVKRRSTSSSARSSSLLGLPLWLLIAARDQARRRAGPVFYRDRRIGLGEREFGMLKFRTMVADARRAAGGARGGERGGGRALQDPRRPARDARRAACCAASRSTRCRSC